MPRRIVVQTLEPHDGERRRAGRSLVEIAVALTLVLAIAAIASTFGIERAAADEIGNAFLASGGDRMAVGAVLLAIFAGLCVLSTFMLRSAVGAEPRPLPRRHRQG